MGRVVAAAKQTWSRGFFWERIDSIDATLDPNPLEGSGVWTKGCLERLGLRNLQD